MKLRNVNPRVIAQSAILKQQTTLL